VKLGLKTVEEQSSGGSNRSLSAMQYLDSLFSQASQAAVLMKRAN